VPVGDRQHRGPVAGAQARGCIRQGPPTWPQYGFAGLALLLGVTAGVAGLGDVAWLAGAAGVLAGGFGGFQSKADLNAGVLARFHFAQAAGYADIGRRFRALAEGPEEPTRQDLDDLSVEWRQLRSRIVQAVNDGRDA
jgi:hypothetical protein